MRRTVLLAVVMVGAVAACGRAAPDPGSDPVVLPTGTRLVAQLSYLGGNGPMWAAVLQTPYVSVYADGTVVVAANRTLTLRGAEVTDLVGTLRRDLRGFAGRVEAAGTREVLDATTTVLEVIGADGTLRAVDAYALDSVPGYPDRLIAARDALTALAERANRDGTAYTADRIRLVAEERRDSPDEPVRPWPAAVPVPTERKFGCRVAELTGRDAVAVARTWPTTWPAEPVTEPKPVLRLADGTRLAVTWRYLLPHEPTS